MIEAGKQKKTWKTNFQADANSNSFDDSMQDHNRKQILIFQIDFWGITEQFPHLDAFCYLMKIKNRNEKVLIVYCHSCAYGKWKRVLRSSRLISAEGKKLKTLINPNFILKARSLWQRLWICPPGCGMHAWQKNVLTYSEHVRGSLVRVEAAPKSLDREQRILKN